MQLFLRLRAAAQPLQRREEWLSLGTWVLALAVLEAAGPASPSDAIDGVLLAGVLALGLATARVHGRHDLRWVDGLAQGARAAAAWVRGLGTQVGIDFRGTPRLRRGTPRLLVAAPALAAGLLLAVAASAAHLPEGLRTLAGAAYVPYLLCLALLWTALGLGVLVSTGLTLAWVHDRLLSDRVGAAHRRRVALGGLGALALGLALAALVPARFAWWTGAGLVLLTATTIALSPVRYDLVWTDRDGERRALPWRRYVGRCGMVLGLAALAPTLIGMGDEVVGVGPADTTLGVTRLLARAFAWTSAALLGALLLQLLLFLRLNVVFARARRARPAVRLEGAAGEDDRAALRGLGWRVVDGPAQPGELRLRVEPGAAVQDPLFGPTRPPAVPPGWLARPSSRTRLERHRVQDLRRRILRGVRRAIKAAAGRCFTHGQGYWVAPHLWFVRGLTRDRGERELAEGEPVFEERVGPPWEQLMTWEARAYLHEVLHGLEVDLIFVEDGVGHRRLLRVLRAIFEVHDLHGAARLEERQLSLVPGVRVLIQDDGGLAAPFKRRGLPEPDYEDVGRARLLLVFKDRGEQHEPARAPQDSSDLPVPLLLG